MMDIEPEYAEVYSFKERLRLVLIGLAVAGVLILALDQWVLPRLDAFVAQAPCTELWGIPGAAVVFYGWFAGTPLLFGLVAAVVLWRRGLRILRDRQVPYRGEKMFRPTRIRRGRPAVLIGWVHLLAPCLFVLLAIWGGFQAHALAATIEHKPASACGSPLQE